MRRLRLILVAPASLVALVLSNQPVWAVGSFSIQLTAGPNLQANPDALAAFQRSVEEWQAVIASPIRVNINADLAAIPNPFVIGSSDIGLANPNLDYTTVRDAMAARASKPGDGLLAYLPTTLQITAHVPTAVGDTFDNTTLGVSHANQKALGLVLDPLNDTTIDGDITFNSNFSFDYDRRDGVSPVAIDFQTAATHEIGHILGFLSDTDDYDSVFGISDNVTTLDLFRFDSANLPTTPAEFTTFPRELFPGVEASFTDLINDYSMSTGSNFGDGNQASHWKDDQITGNLIGIMDPSIGDGQLETISAADLRVFELIGYETVPEPGTVLLLTLAALAALSRRFSCAGNSL
jgi:hypothetical protein